MIYLCVKISVDIFEHHIIYKLYFTITIVQITFIHVYLYIRLFESLFIYGWQGELTQTGGALDEPIAWSKGAIFGL